MTTRTVYTSTVTVPVYASWKCEKCGKTNFTTGKIACTYSVSSDSLRSSKQKDAKVKAASLANLKWTEKAFRIISNPNSYAQDVKDGLVLDNIYCTNCGKKPKWKGDEKYSICGYICLVCAILSGLAAINSMVNIVAWVIFGVLLAMTIIAFVVSSRYKAMMRNLPKEYTPVIGTLNNELIEYAKAHGVTILNPDECIAAVAGNDSLTSVSIPTDKIVDKGDINDDI